MLCAILYFIIFIYFTESLGEAEMAKAKLQVEIHDLRQELSQIEVNKSNLHEEIKSKMQHWKVNYCLFLC